MVSTGRHRPFARWALIGCVLMAVLTLGAALADALPSDEDFFATPETRAALFDAIADRLEEAYWDPELIDWPSWRERYRVEVMRTTSQGTFDLVMRRAIQTWGDGHSRWVGRDPAASVVQPFRLPQRDVPVGPEGPGNLPGDSESVVPKTSVDLGAATVPLSGRGLLILRAYPGAAAEVAGLRRGDVIVTANGEDLQTPGLRWQMLDFIAAALRTGQASLVVDRPAAGRVKVMVEPRDVPGGAANQPTLVMDSATGAATVTIPIFETGVAARVHSLVSSAKQQGATALVLDVRGNPGGNLIELGLVAAVFVQGAPVEAWSPQGRRWSLTVERTVGGVRAALVHDAGAFVGTPLAVGQLIESETWSGPLAVLVDQRTASAAEALAAMAVREVDATIHGRTTAGNVESVRLVAVPGGNRVWLAVGELRYPGGAPLAPVVPSTQLEASAERVADGYDAPLAEAIRSMLGLPVTPGRWF